MNPCDQLRTFFLSKFNEAKCVDQYNESNGEMQDSLISCLCTLDVPRKLFLSKYRSLFQLEVLDQDEKLELKKDVHRRFPDKTVEFKLEAAKIIFTINQLL